MRIMGHGVDIQVLGRIKQLLTLSHNDWLDGVFTAKEQEAAANELTKQVEHYAGRYAAKEAVAKALGTGFSDDVAWLDVEIRNKPTGAPEIHLSGGAYEVARALGITGWLVSLSHSGDYAVASVIAVAEER